MDSIIKEFKINLESNNCDFSMIIQKIEEIQKTLEESDDLNKKINCENYSNIEEEINKNNELLELVSNILFIIEKIEEY